MNDNYNEYLHWVLFAVPGMLTPTNIAAMSIAINNMPADKPVVEIGSFCGLSTIVLSHILDRVGGNSLLFSCDKWEFEGQDLGKLVADSPSLTHDAYQEYVKETFKRSLMTFSSHRLPHTIEAVSDDFFRQWFTNESVIDVFGRKTDLGGEIGFCYIDGNHTYEFARRDFENTDRALVSGGYVLFDDSGDGTIWGVNQLVREIADDARYQLVSKNPNYLFRKR